MKYVFLVDCLVVFWVFIIVYIIPSGSTSYLLQWYHKLLPYFPYISLSNSTFLWIWTWHSIIFQPDALTGRTSHWIRHGADGKKTTHRPTVLRIWDRVSLQMGSGPWYMGARFQISTYGFKLQVILKNSACLVLTLALLSRPPDDYMASFVSYCSFIVNTCYRLY